MSGAEQTDFAKAQDAHEVVDVGRSHEEAWRARLSRQLTRLAAILTPIVLLPALWGTDDPRLKTVLVLVTVTVTASLVLLSHPRTPQSVRGAGVVVVFAVIGFAGYGTLGYLSGPGVAVAASVALAGLLFGRKGMLLTTAGIALVVGLLGTLMVQGVLRAPLISDISPTRAQPWIRSSVISLLLVLIIGAVVTWVVENIESALARVAKESRRREEAELHVQQAQRTELVAQLAAGVAHDLNNYLTVISAWSGMIASSPKQINLGEASEAISEAIEHASSLTRRLLMLVRRDIAEVEPIDLREFLDTNEQILKALLPMGVALHTESDASVWCEMDRGQLHQVLLNLAVNARDAMPKGGSLRIEARHRAATAGVGRLGPIPKGDWVVLSVSDTGVGMDEGLARRAFEPFFTTKGVGKGTGLGLATIAAIVEHCGGHLVLQTQPGKGTCIEVWLRSTAPAKESRRHTSSEGAPALDGLRVLLVEDIESVLRASALTLSESGAVVVTAADGDQALARIAEQPFDALCSDVVMPGASVTTVAEAFAEANPGGVMLLCSGFVGEESVRRDIERGRYAYLEKPYTPLALVTMLAKLDAGKSKQVG